MLTRVFMLIAILVGITALGASYRSMSPGFALAQDADADLIATIEALQTQVDEQEARISKLEEDVSLLLAEDAGPEIEDAATGMQTITGSLTLIGATDAKTVGDLTFRIIDMGETDGCIGNGGYADLVGGRQIIVMDGSGQTIAVGEGQPGVLHRSDNTCEFAFTVEGVPASDFYTIRIGSREGPTYTFEDLEAMSWHVELSIG